MARRRPGPNPAYCCHWCGKPLTIYECVVTVDGERVCADNCLAGTLFSERDRHAGEAPDPDALAAPCGSWMSADDIPE